MPLKDNFTDREYPRGIVHEIISELAQFSERGKIYFTSMGARLSDRHTVLLYLAALQGFHLVSDSAYDGATLSKIEDETCMPRRFIRAALEELERNRLIEKRWGRWTIRVPGLPIIKAEFDAIREATKKEKKDDKKEEKKEDKKEEKKEEEKGDKTKDSKSEACPGVKTNVLFAFSSGRD